MLINFWEFWAVTSIFFCFPMLSPPVNVKLCSVDVCSLVDHSYSSPVFEAKVCGSSNKRVSHFHNEHLEIRMGCLSNIDLTLFCGMQHPCAPPNQHWVMITGKINRSPWIRSDAFWLFLFKPDEYPTTAGAFSTIFPARENTLTRFTMTSGASKATLIALRRASNSPQSFRDLEDARSFAFKRYNSSKVWCGFRTGRSLTDLSLS